jgi:hypothetical protein
MIVMKKNLRRKLAGLSRLLLAGALALAVALDAQATIMRYLDVEDLTRLSSDVIHGRVVDLSTYWSPDHTKIYTAIKVEVKERFKGSIASGQTITITQLGGEKDGMMLDFAGRPQFALGEMVVLFTTRSSSHLLIVGLKQGKMRVEGDEAVRDFSGITLVETESGGRGLQTIRPKRTRIAFDELRRRVANTK